jgi:hypothetical protein
LEEQRQCHNSIIQTGAGVTRARFGRAGSVQLAVARKPGSARKDSTVSDEPAGGAREHRRLLHK